MHVIPALGRLRQEDYKFEPCLGCIARPHLKIQNKTNKETNKKLIAMYDLHLF
jgi:hypothetical protein